MASRAHALTLWRIAARSLHHRHHRNLVPTSFATTALDFDCGATQGSSTSSREFLSLCSSGEFAFGRGVGLGFRDEFDRDGVVAPWRFRRASTATSENSKPAEEVAEGITLTDNCIRRIQEIKNEEGPDGDNKMLRLSVEGGGCSGFLYNFALDDKVNKDDRVFERDGAKLVVDDISYGFIKGATVDFTEELIRASFAVSGFMDACFFWSLIILESCGHLSLNGKSIFTTHLSICSGLYISNKTMSAEL
ncbi:hypothetical protein KC19_1G192400 [Ceratodon purpureus]|uniref:Core domain-containing protein n=1 Tax=Ceratodon purpureus TaxID=3225 RepID=A0A8T0J9P1_CERPU|nr:hypothetical protein KC19_1G192400 [Ceratodon purpureus]